MKEKEPKKGRGAVTLRRIRIMCFVITGLFLVNAFNLYKRMMGAEEVVSALSDQYVKPVGIFDPRGNIYDSRGIRLTNTQGICGIYAPSKAESAAVAKNVVGEVAIDKDKTTSEGCKGISGIQELYDSLLSGGSAVKLNAYVDAMGNVTDAGYYVLNDHINEGCDIYLTLDYHIQKRYEEVLKEYSAQNNVKNLSAVLIEIKTGNILAVASEGGEMNNAVLSYQPGSIMKIITAAVAYERGLIDESTTYDCDGKVDVGGHERGCAGGAVHGNITIARALGVSCNCCFYTLAKELTYELPNGAMGSYVLDKARLWGFSSYGQPNKDRFPLEYEEHYSFVPEMLYNEMDIFNCALGEGRTQASCLIMAKITGAIAGGGVMNEPKIVDRITDAAGNIVPLEDEKVFDLGLKAETIEWLKGAMLQTAISGTAAGVDLNATGGFAGKTGTAENASDKPHGWFTGYFPANSPEYSLCVFIEQGTSGIKAAGLFGILAKELYNIYPD